MKKGFLLLLIFPLLHLACDKGKCKSKPLQYFNITGLDFLPSTTENNHTHFLTDLDSTQFEKFYFNGLFQAEYYSVELKPVFSIFPQAYADDPCPSPGYNGSDEKLAGIYLIALGKYNANIHPGDTLKDNYRINMQLPSEYLSINSQKIQDQQLNISLTEKPDPKEYQSFKLIYKLTNGETYEAITPRFKLY